MFINCKIVGRNVNSNEYHALKEKAKRGDPAFVMSPSAINLFASIPPSKWIAGYERKDSPAKAYGNIFDTLDLTPDQFATKYVIEPEFYLDKVMVCPSCESESDSQSCRACGCKREPRETQKAWDYKSKERKAWKAECLAKGLEPVPFKTHADAQAAIKRLLEPVIDASGKPDDTIQRWHDCCERQVLITGEWKCPHTGLVIPVSALLDFEPRKDSEFGNCLGDLKSTMSGQPFMFQNQAKKFGWHRQAAFDLDIYRAATGEMNRNTWCFIISENFDPWEPNRAVYPEKDETGLPSFIDLGRDHQYGGYEMALAHYCKCLHTGRWPRYNDLADTVQGWVILRPIPRDVEKSMFGVNMSFGEGPAEDPEWLSDEPPAEGESETDEVPA